MKFVRSLPILACALFWACDSPHLTVLWKKFEHPTYRFSIKVPRGWEIRKDDVMNVAVSVLAPEKEGAFRANANVVVTLRKEQIPLSRLADQAVAQLTLMMSHYEVVGQAHTNLGAIPAMEIRAKYSSNDGTRIVRTVLAVTEKMQYVLTFTTREETEEDYAPIFGAILSSFSVPQT